MMKHTVVRKQHNSKMCFVCGLKNSSGLQASFYEMENNELVALFVPTVEHQSYPGRMHGGIASTILDETIGRAILVGRDDDVWGVTLELQVKYKKPIPLGTEIKVIARLTEEGNRFFKGSGEIVLPNGDVAVTAEGRYMKASLDKIADFDPEENEWRVVAKDDDPESIEITLNR
jgi:uncharacterized protein (TIGR00369 family)